MRFVLLLILLMAVSCGENLSSKKDGKTRERQSEEYLTDIKEVDLLDIAVDVPVEVSGNKVTFKKAFSESTEGVRSTCNVAVNSEDTWNYKVDGNSMVMVTGSGEKIKLRRVSGEPNSIVGSWTSKSYQGDQLVMRRLTFVSENRLVMRTHCEG